MDNSRFSITPRISEVNSGNHIGNQILPVWFEEARLSIMHQLLQHLTPSATHMVRHAAYDYARELRYGSDVEIRNGIAKTGTTSITFYQEAWQHGARAVTATTTIVLFDRNTNATTPLTATGREFLRPFAIAGEL